MFHCPGCKALYNTDTPCDHPYIGSSRACWEVYEQVLAKEFSDPAYFKVHRITVDAYAASHIGDQSDRRARQSANLHLIALYLFFQKGAPIHEIKTFLSQATTPKRDWPVVQSVDSPDWLTVYDVVKASNPEEHEALVYQWGRSVLGNYQAMENELQRMVELF